VLDYGGGLCPLRIAARAILPQVELEFHCKEVPALARIGRILHPEVTWHDDDSCLDQTFDLIIFGAVLQYVRDWASLLQRAARAARSHVYITNLSVVMNSQSYVAVQRVRGASLLMLQINHRELMEAASAAGLRPTRQFPPQTHVPITGAPEQPTYFSCLFERAKVTT
jgi:putative methyltransferase (TIGR04325 family)